MSSDRDASAGVTWRDVEELIREIQKQHCCDINVQLSCPMASGTSVLFWVKAEARPRIVGRSTIRGPAAAARRWPHVDHRTMPGCILATLFELWRMLDLQGHVPAEQATFDWDT